MKDIVIVRPGGEPTNHPVHALILDNPAAEAAAGAAAVAIAVALQVPPKVAARLLAKAHAPADHHDY
jgi:hypothetical protein